MDGLTIDGWMDGLTIDGWMDGLTIDGLIQDNHGRRLTID
jgi:hypothetical protein